MSAFSKFCFFFLDKPLPTFPVDQNIFKVLKERVILARAIDKSEHRIKRLSAQNRWILNAAKEMDIDIEDDNLYPFNFIIKMNFISILLRLNLLSLCINLVV